METEKKSELTHDTPSLLEGEISHQASPPSNNVSLIQDAIEAIGMGRYQWQLMASCGFGFIADQVIAIDILRNSCPNRSSDASSFHQSCNAASVQGVCATICDSTTCHSVCRTGRGCYSLRISGGSCRPSFDMADIDFRGVDIHGCWCCLAHLGCLECVCCLGSLFWWRKLLALFRFFSFSFRASC